MPQTLQEESTQTMFADLHDTSILETLIESASRVICPVWPLHGAVACNPLLDLEDRPFWEAVNLFKNSFYQPLDPKVHHINQLMIKWLEPFLDESSSFIEMPCKHLGFWNCFTQLACYDKSVVFSKEALKKLRQLPDNPLDAIAVICQKLGIVQADALEIFQNQLSSLSGWSGYVKWYSQWQPAHERRLAIDLSHLLAVRLTLIWIIYGNSHYPLKPTHSSKRPSYDHIASHVEEKEAHFLNKLFKHLSPFSPQPSSPSKALAQFVFCIDARSEPVRRALESINNYRTYGFAGFFGLNINVCPTDEAAFSSCPVLLSASACIDADYKDKSQGYFIKKQGLHVYKSLKNRFGTAFTLVETLGFFSGLYLTLKTFFPKAARSLESLVTKPKMAHLSLRGFDLNQKVMFAKTALSMLDLTHQMSDLVIICGHGSQSLNNPFASSLDCGACGGHPGDVNARVLSKILSDPHVRKLLKEEGYVIPPSTKFIGAFHNTVTDEITLFEEDLETTLELTRLKQDLKAASSQAQSLKFAHLRVSDNTKTSNPSHDWSETRPEWGLAGNAAFIIAPRDMTSDLNLNGRVFLHSYDYTKDNGYKFLETILTAPVIVAQWINTQYFFSCLDPIAFGSLSKTVHNITGKLGVMRGNSSDLMHGLPLESVYVTEKKSYHELLRLHVIVHAPFEEVIKIVDKHKNLTNLVYHQWIKLIILDPRNAQKYTLSQDKTWQNESF